MSSAMDERKKVIVAIAVAASQHLLDTVMRVTQTEEEDEVLDVQAYVLYTIIQKLRGRRESPTRIRGYVEETVPNMNSSQFRQHFRMTPQIFNDLENLMGPFLSKHSNMGRSVIPVRKQLLSTLWLLATPDSFRSVGDRFNMGKSSGSDCSMRVVRSICRISGRIIKWPNEQEIGNIKRKFYCLAKLPDIVGAIDGSDIEIKAPHIEPQAYTNRKKRYAMILQAVCNPELKFIDCFAGCFGSVGDLRVLRNSPLWAEIRMQEAVMFPDNGYLIGDKIYPVLSWLIPAFKDHGALTDAQKNFNKAHARSRQVIERAFSLLKGRFRRLKYLDMNRVDMISYVILACCVLHNICLCGVNDNIEDFIEEGHNFMNLRGNPEEGGGVMEGPQEDAGAAKRNYLVTIVPQL